MSRPSDRKELTLFSKPPLLITESEEEFRFLKRSFGAGDQTARLCRAHVC